MALVKRACGSVRSDRIDLVSTLLKKNISSFTQMTMDDILYATELLEAWENTQKVRFANGTLVTEAMMVCDMMDLRIPHLSHNSLLSDEKSRKEYLKMAGKDVHIKYATDGFDDFENDVDAITSGLDDTVTTIPETHSGRWPSDMVIQAPTVGLGLALGTGGFPRGKIVHFYGAKHSGKSMIAYRIGAKSQEQGIPVVLIDAEAAMDADFANSLGLDLDPKMLKVILPGNIEELSNTLIELSGKPYTVIVDSIASSASKVELTRDRTKKEARVGGNAKAWADTLAVIRTRLLLNGGTLILINQVRKNMDAGMFGDPNRPWGSDVIQHQVDISFLVTAAKESVDYFNKKGFKISRLHMKKNRFDDMTDIKIDLTYRPGNPYNTSLDLLRTCDKKISSGSSVTFGEMAKNVLVKNAAPSKDGKETVSNRGKFSIRIDPLMMSAIQADEPDFSEVAIDPIEGWEAPDNWFDVEVPDVDEENSEYFGLPNLHERPAVIWLNRHPVAAELISERMLNALKYKKDILNSENE